jgi:hypothetical protein
MILDGSGQGGPLFRVAERFSSLNENNGLHANNAAIAKPVTRYGAIQSMRIAL